MRGAPFWLALPVLTTLLTGVLQAQSAQAISLQFSGLYNGVLGNGLGSIQDGWGGEAQVRYTPGALSVGAGFQYTVHNLDDQDPQTDDASLYGAFIEPRYRIHTGSNVVAPYVSARLSLLKVGFSGGDLSTTSNFIQLNGGGGLLYRVGSRVNLDVGATFGYNRIGAGTLKSRTGPDRPFASGSGTNVVFRLGFALGLGG